jgi:hypothetical protein
MRRVAPLLLLTGALIVGGFILALLQGRPIPAPSLVFFIFGAGMLAASIRILVPSYPQSVQKRFGKLEAMTEEQRQGYLARMFRKQLLVVTIVLIIEIPVAALSWSYVDWRQWIVGAIATTVLFMVLLGAITLQRRKAALP